MSAREPLRNQAFATRSDGRSEEATLYRRLYLSSRWRRIRHHQLAAQPLCEWCVEAEIVTEATEVHHATPHRGDLDLFWSGPFISTCRPCHASRGQLEDNGKTVVRYGPDGWPL
ncbi:HNH endonuclease [Rhizobium leguminosarum bv. viciae]|nr:HNH endonuclease [Rhizobium leguminosarum bv. viciae]